jgi:hypothetical protein
MPSAPSFDTAIHSLVAEAVESALAPHRHILERLAELLDGAAPQKRGPGRPPKSAAAPKRKGRRRGGKARKASGAAKHFSAGEKVIYKQGRGSFEAMIVRTDAAKGLVTIERISDGKRVVRPATKLKAA